MLEWMLFQHGVDLENIVWEYKYKGLYIESLKHILPKQFPL